MDIENLSKRFKEDGYIYIENFFDGNLMDSYHQKILSHFKKDTEYKHDMTFIKNQTRMLFHGFLSLREKQFLILLKMTKDCKRLQKKYLAVDGSLCTA
jgi:hypothetical protein